MKTPLQTLNHSTIEFYEKLSAWEARIVKAQGLSLPLVHAVEILGAFGAMPMKDLAEKVGVTTGTLTVQVDKLTELCLVERVPHQTDRRSILVALTAQGRAVFAEHDQAHLQLVTQLTADFSEQQLATFSELFSELNKKF